MQFQIHTLLPMAEKEFFLLLVFRLVEQSTQNTVVQITNIRQKAQISMTQTHFQAKPNMAKNKFAQYKLAIDGMSA